jgi:HCOMODA/2-hydroxy-3-carboxy-muconic semialdehyde decarboxylase
MRNVNPSSKCRREFLDVLAATTSILLIKGLPAWAGQQPGGSSSGPTVEGVIEDLVAANRILAQEGIVDGYGHVSVRHPATPDRFLMSRSVAPESVEAADVMEYGLEGEPIDARGRSSYQERFIHSEIYRMRRDVNAVIHCHTPSLIPFANSDVPLRAMYPLGAFIAEGVPVFEIRAVAGMTDLLVRTAKLGSALASVLGDKPAVLMRGHGAVIVGLTIPHVVGRSIAMDINARTQSQGIALGGRITYIDPEEARQRSDPRIYDRAWELWKKSIRK